MTPPLRCHYCLEDVDPAGPAIATRIFPPRGRHAERRLDTHYVPFLDEWPIRDRPVLELAHPTCFAGAEGLDEFLQAVRRNDYDARPDRLREVHGAVVEVVLTDAERLVLVRGLWQWDGPAHPTRELAVALGFAHVADLLDETRRMRDLLEAEAPMSPFDWSRALLATEIVFASDVLGGASDWEIVTALDIHETLTVLRGLQDKLRKQDIIVRPGYRASP